MNWANRLQWRVVVPVAALAAMTAAGLPAAAQAAGPPGRGAGPNAPVYMGIPGRTAGSAAAQAAVAPQGGATPAIAATGDASVPVVFDYTGSDGHVYEASLAAPTSAVSLGGTVTGGPALTFSPAPLGPELVGPFVHGPQNQAWWYVGGAPAWISLGGGLTSRPGAAAGALSVTGGEALDVVVRGPDGAVWIKQFTHTTETNWTSLGGHTSLGSGPAAVNVGGTLYVLALDTAGTVFVNRSTDGAHWSGWRSLGGTASGDVGVATPARGVGVVFVRGPGNAAFYKEFAGTTPGVTAGWHSLGGSLTSGVGAGATSHGATYALVLGPNGAIDARGGIWPKLGNWVQLVAGP
jgi:hypothetical protein